MKKPEVFKPITLIENCSRYLILSKSKLEFLSNFNDLGIDGI